MMNAPTPAAPAQIPPEALTQESFAAIQREHIDWLMNEGKEGRRATFKEADLRFIDFADANLVQANFRGADLRGCDLTGAQLQEADFTEARLDSANLSGVNVERSSFASASLERAVLDGANAASANFLNANLSDASLRHTSLPGAVLRQAIANRALFDHTNLADANARQSSLQGAKFHGTQLARADLRESRCDRAVFQDVRFDQTQCKGATFDGVSFTGSDFSEALEISQEYKSAALQETRVKLEHERGELHSREEALRRGTADIEAREAALRDVAGMEDEASRRLSGIGGQLAIVAILWAAILLLLIAATVLGVASLPKGSVSGGGIALVIGVPLVVVLVSGFAALRVRTAARLLREHAQLRESKLIVVHDTGNEHPTTLPGIPVASDLPAPMALDARFSL